MEYLLKYRLQWGKPDRLSLLPSELKCDDVEVEPLPEDAPLPAYFTADIHPSLVSIIQNDWPYSGESFFAFVTSPTNVLTKSFIH